MLHFDSDYMEGAHPEILRRLTEYNFTQQPGYGSDEICEAAREKIRLACACPDAAVHFLVGGTQTNATVIAALLGPCEGVVCAATGHINVHEAGAVEHTGHKVLPLPSQDGKVDAQALDAYLTAFWRDENHTHMVLPGMVYLSHPTEVGTCYTREELESLHAVCRSFSIPLYLDGARLGYGLAAAPDVDLPCIARCCDAFYIGGTKVGALFGEAVVLPDPARIPHFFTIIKQQGALLAKGWLLGLQFDTLFTDGRYTAMGAHAVALAQKLRRGLVEKGYRLLLDSPSNQQFVVLEQSQLQALASQVTFSIWEPVDQTHTAIRLVTSWASTEADVDALLALL